MVLVALAIFYGIQSFINKMSKGYKWYQIAFMKQLKALLGYLSGQNINYLEFRLLVEQVGIVFVSQDEEKRCHHLFQKFGFISKLQFVSSISLVSIEAKHCRRYYVVRLRPTVHELEHQGKKCFHFWIDIMQKKCGPTHGWFQILCQEKDIRRVSIQKFISHLNRILKDTLHQQCAHKISTQFQKSKRNEIQITVFTNTLRIHRKLLSKSKGKLSYQLLESYETKVRDECYFCDFSNKRFLWKISQQQEMERWVSQKQVLDSIEAEICGKKLKLIVFHMIFLNQQLQS